MSPRPSSWIRASATVWRARVRRGQSRAPAGACRQSAAPVQLRAWVCSVASRSSASSFFGIERQRRLQVRGARGSARSGASWYSAPSLRWMLREQCADRRPAARAALSAAAASAYCCASSSELGPSAPARRAWLGVRRERPLQQRHAPWRDLSASVEVQLGAAGEVGAPRRRRRAGPAWPRRAARAGPPDPRRRRAGRADPPGPVAAAACSGSRSSALPVQGGGAVRHRSACARRASRRGDEAPRRALRGSRLARASASSVGAGGATLPSLSCTRRAALQRGQALRLQPPARLGRAAPARCRSPSLCSARVGAAQHQLARARWAPSPASRRLLVQLDEAGGVTAPAAGRAPARRPAHVGGILAGRPACSSSSVGSVRAACPDRRRRTGAARLRSCAAPARARRGGSAARRGAACLQRGCARASSARRIGRHRARARPRSTARRAPARCKRSR